MSKEELIRILSEKLPEDADITYASATWWDDIGCHNWDTDLEDSDLKSNTFRVSLTDQIDNRSNKGQ